MAEKRTPGPVGSIVGVQRQPRTGEKREYLPDMTLTMAIPCLDLIPGVPGISRETLIQFERMAEATAKAGYNVHILPPELTKTSNTPVTRWKIVQRMKGDWLLMMDADAFPEPDTLNKLLLAAKEDPKNLRKVVAVPSVRPSYPHHACFCNINKDGLLIPWRYGIEYGDDEVDAQETCIREVDGTGFHCVLIHRSVFQIPNFDPPWFELNVADEETGVIYGHDYRFCRRVKRLGGIQVYIDFSCRVGHFGLKPFTLADNRAIMMSNPAEMERQKELEVDVEANIEDEDTEHLANLFSKMRQKETPEIFMPKEAIE
jgi:hypothetical protein